MARLMGSKKMVFRVLLYGTCSSFWRYIMTTTHGTTILMYILLNF